MGGLLPRAQLGPHGQGSPAGVRRVLLRGCEEQLCDAELQCVSLPVIRCDIALFSFLALRSLRACPCTAVQPSTGGPAEVGTPESGFVGPCHRLVYRCLDMVCATSE